MKIQESYIGIDCLSLPENFSGAGYYMYYLTLESLQLNRSFPIAVFCKPKHSHLFAPYLKFADKLVPIPLKNRIHRLFFYEYGLEEHLIKEKVKLFHATHYFCPPRNKNYKIITTFHDMGFFLYPDYYPFLKRSFFRNRMKTFLNRSDRIIAISKSTRNTILKFFPDFEKKVSVIYPGVDHLLKENIKSISYQKFKGPFILAVNSFEKRKNILFIIKLFNLLKKNYCTNHKMIIIGHTANGYQQILKEKEESIFSPDIHILKSVPIEQVDYFYRNSEFFINASSYEGFGFSPFEAINYNLPTFLFKNQVIAELLNHHPYIFTNLNEGIWAEHIYNEFQNGFANKISPKAINSLTWKNSAQQSFELFHQSIFGEEVAVA